MLEEQSSGRLCLNFSRWGGTHHLIDARDVCLRVGEQYQPLLSVSTSHTLLVGERAQCLHVKRFLHTHTHRIHNQNAEISAFAGDFSCFSCLFTKFLEVSVFAEQAFISETADCHALTNLVGQHEGIHDVDHLLVGLRKVRSDLLHQPFFARHSILSIAILQASMQASQTPNVNEKIAQES